MAGLVVEGSNYDLGGTGFFNLSTYTEFRGLNFALGGDEGATTVANFMKHYNPTVQGAFIGNHLITYCTELLCPPLLCKLPCY